ncbi:SPT3 Dosage dependent suppressor of Ty-induced promoter mutations-like protein [Paecilomyces lecythidis]|uniref:SPT3 Dosage dependent suppressor of Ty-induced promoter mutations-like protein n=1 Tax=Paecilomyces lecythidis TaxID=3004212 RepID=A0ABR3XHH3_9EURO
MASPYQDPNMGFLDPTRLQTSSAGAGREFDDLFSRTTASRAARDAESYLAPSELSTKRRYRDQDTLTQPHTVAADSPADTPDNSSRSSSSESPRNHIRTTSVASTNSAMRDNTASDGRYHSDAWLNSDFGLKEEPLFGLDADMPPLDGGFHMDTDLETSNKAMDSAFDFESAASSPSPLKMESSSLPKSQKMFKNQLRSPSNPPVHFAHSKMASPGTTSASPFFSHSSREASPMTSSMLPNQGRSSFKQWDGRSPSSALEETFGGINMNGGSPLSTTLSPSLNIGSSGLPFGLSEWPSEQAMAAQNFAQSIPLNPRPEAPMRPILTVHPTSLKSRVETQIPIKMTLYPLPAGVKKLRLPSHTISKPKFLAKPDTERSPEILELHTSLVCTSAMQDQEKLKKAFARARGIRYKRSSSAGQDTSESTSEEDKPLDGGEVKICAGCIQRERKRASRKKQRKPDEDELFQKDEEKRVIVFNTNEIKDWTEPSKTAVPSYSDMAASMVPAGAMQVELPMRIACYCRHQNEKLGFQVIFTIKDYQDNVISQAITNSIMITDDHKTHAPPAPAPPPSSALPDGTQLPGAGVFVPGPNIDVGNASAGQPSFRLSHSTTDLQGLQQKYSPQQYPLTPGAFVIPQNGVSGTSGSLSGRSLSRQASPSEFQAPSSKRRKHSGGSIKLPSGLTMTKLEQSHASSASASSSNGPNASSARAFTSPIERPFATPASLPGQFTNGPPTPNNNENNPFFNSNGQHGSLDSLSQQQLISAPNSAHPSRPGTPGVSGRNSFPDPALSMNITSGPANSIWPSLTSTTNRLPSIIHKLVPAEGSTTGGTEVTLLGSGFYPGMEVVFGDTLATTTTFWGDKCLNCLTPPALQPGLVPVVFKHEHPTFGQPHQNQPLIPKQQLFFRYVDDRELQMYRLALGILGQKLRSPADAFQTAQQIMGGDPTIWNLQTDFQGGSSGGHQRQVPGLGAQGKTSDMDSKMLTYLEFLDLDDNPRSPKYNMRSATGHTLLHFASSLGLTRFVAGLLARGANPDVEDNNGNTPMHLAALSGHAHIVHRLRLAGANADARSIRDFAPADLATTLIAHQAALIPARHYRSRSVGSTPSQRRRSHSTVSLNSLWETSSASGSLGYEIDDSTDSEDSEADSDDDSGYYRASSRRSSVQHDATASLYYTRSREGTIPADGIQTPAETTDVEDTRSFSPPAALIAWRNQLATQINQFQQSVGRAFPNLPALPPMPPMPALPDYQAHPMMRRITNLVPHRPTTPWSAKEGWWDLLTGNSAPNNTQPPAYEELYPHKEENEEDLDTKKTSLVRAAADAAVDQHFETLETRASSSKSRPVKEEIKDIRIGRKTISREQQEQLRQQQARRMKGLGSDRNLYFFWIPVLLLVICAYLRNLLPGVGQGFSQGYEFIKARYGRSMEVGL